MLNWRRLLSFRHEDKPSSPSSCEGKTSSFPPCISFSTASASSWPLISESSAQSHQPGPDPACKNPQSLLASANVIVEKETITPRHGPGYKHNYTPLNRESSEIRLFSFHKGIDGKIVGRHHVFSISMCPKFIALSYTWGTPGSETIISLDGNDFSIRHNLNEALKSIIRLRARHRALPNPQNRLTDLCDKAANCQYFWIDSICIDQQDVLERNHQVGLMKSIYSDADFVITWLGSQDGAYRDIRMQDIKLPEEYVRLQASLLPDFLLYMGGLKDCEYWRRLWIVQEVVLARDILVGWGNDFFSWKDLEIIAKRIAYSYPNYPNGIDKRIAHNSYPKYPNGIERNRMDPTGSKIYDQAEWMTLVEQRLRWREKTEDTVALGSWTQRIVNEKSTGVRVIVTLSSLIQQFARQECTDVRDKVIGLLGLAPGDVTHLADYSLPLEDFFSAVCQHVFAESDMTSREAQLGFQGFLGANLGIPTDVRRKPIRYISLDR